MASTVSPGAPIESYNSETGETTWIDVTVVNHPARGTTPAMTHGWTAPQLAAARAGEAPVGCEECRVALDLPAGDV